MIGAPEVTQCYYVTGQADFILILTLKDMQDFDAFTRRIFSEDSNVRRFQTSIVVNAVKSGLSVPIDRTSRK